MNISVQNSSVAMIHISLSLSQYECTYEKEEESIFYVLNYNRDMLYDSLSASVLTRKSGMNLL